MIQHSLRTAIVVETKDHGLCGILTRLGVSAIPARSADEALDISRQRIIDLAFADILLPGMGGAALLHALAHAQPGICPGCVLTAIAGFPAHEIEFPLLTRPCTPEAVQRLLDDLLPENRSIPPQTQTRILALLDRLGVPGHAGRTHLARAIGMTMYDSRLSGQLSRRIYPALSKQSGAAAAQVERAIRHCIDTAWRKGSVEEQYRIFGNTIDAQRGKPAIAQMIARCADILRLEESL